MRKIEKVGTSPGIRILVRCFDCCTIICLDKYARNILKCLILNFGLSKPTKNFVNMGLR